MDRTDTDPSELTCQPIVGYIAPQCQNSHFSTIIRFAAPFETEHCADTPPRIGPAIHVQAMNASPRRRLVLICVSTIGLTACESVRELSTDEVRLSDLSPSRCSTRVGLEGRLATDDSTFYYVTPEAMVAGSQSILIAGFPNFKTVVSNSQGRVLEVDADPIFGLVFDHPDRARPIAHPLPDHVVSGVRASAAPGEGADRWKVIFSTAPAGEPERSDTVFSPWYAEIAEGRWHTVPLRIPIPEGIMLLPRSTSTIASDNDGSVVFSMLGIGRDRQRVVVRFSGDERGWTHDVIPTFATQGSTLPVKGSVSSLLLVQPDTTESADINSLFIWRRVDGGWKRGSRLAFGSVDGPAYDPVAVNSNDGAVVSWRSTVRDANGSTGQHLNAAIVTERGEIEHRFVVDSALISIGSSFPPLSIRERHLWAVVHGEPSGRSSMLRLIELNDRRIRILGEFPDPFRGFFASTAIDGGPIVVSGLIHVEQKYIVSLVQIWEVNC